LTVVEALPLLPPLVVQAPGPIGMLQALNAAAVRSGATPNSSGHGCRNLFGALIFMSAMIESITRNCRQPRDAIFSSPQG
jgi:hypothetical protein